MKLTDEYDENVWIVNPRYKMSMYIIVDFGISTSFLTGPISSPFSQHWEDLWGWYYNGVY